MDAFTMIPTANSLRNAITVGLALSGTIFWAPPVTADPPPIVYSVAHSFSQADGAYPSATGLLAQGRDGNVYGTTPDGGQHGCGTAFRLSPNRAVFKKIYDFPPKLCHPQGGLTLGADGLLYGTSQGTGKGQAAIFKLSSTGKPHTLRLLSPAEGAKPESPPIQGANGLFYGVMSSGGSSNDGTLYQIGPKGGSFKVLHNFQPTDGTHPMGPLAIGLDGQLYGTATFGGPTTEGPNPYGTFFRFDPKNGLTVLHTFQLFDHEHPKNESAKPNGPLTRDYQGAFWGTTYGYDTSGGPGLDYGSAFYVKLTPPVSVQIRVFDDLTTMNPTAGLTLVPALEGFVGAGSQQAAHAGSLYLFHLSNDFPYANIEYLLGFGKPAEGATPQSTLLLHTNGNVFGTTVHGGSTATATQPSGYGVIYKLTPVSPAPQATVFAVPQAGSVGQTIGLLGQGFTDATGKSLVTDVAFGPVHADPSSIQALANTFLTVTVPTGSVTGNIVVTLSGGTAVQTALPFPVVSR
ncbi:choice-of-anchor tandem repeat GloVer-containing protein [Methylolobus aquaticus]